MNTVFFIRRFLSKTILLLAIYVQIFVYNSFPVESYFTKINENSM